MYIVCLRTLTFLLAFEWVMKNMTHNCQYVDTVGWHTLTFFTRNSRRVLAVAILSICLSVRMSHGWISQNGAS